MRLSGPKRERQVGMNADTRHRKETRRLRVVNRSSAMSQRHFFDTILLPCADLVGDLGVCLDETRGVMTREGSIATCRSLAPELNRTEVAEPGCDHFARKCSPLGNS